ncbi:non-ribosomal peptide synthetase [Paenibacillus massiliensis]|uniref:non-ribosomal peptide synthetase n=1 Tax=Paenibacillus massiliensis TaxID=225917 RepID=UPI0004706355|nr:non-ribosomal peptide synthetase [Paenibacillus massiliensis]
MSEPKIPIEYELTRAQQRIWYLEQLHPEIPMGNIGGPVIIHGPIQAAILRTAIHTFIYRNDGIRLHMCLRDNQVKQYVAQYQEPNIEFVDFAEEANPEQALKEWVENHAQTRFALLDQDLFRFSIFRLHEQMFGYLPVLHHLIADGWTMQLLTTQISSSYEMLCQGLTHDASDQLSLLPSYREHIARERAYLQSERHRKDKLFWQNLFAETSEMWTETASSSPTGQRLTYIIDSHTSGVIRECANCCGVSLNVLFVFLYLVYCNKITGHTDIVLGTPVLNRSGRQEKSMCGMFTNAMPCRFVLDETSTAQETLQSISRQLAAFYRHQQYPYEQIVRDLELHSRGIRGLYGACVNYYNNRLSIRMNDHTVENLEFYNGYQPYALQWIIREWYEQGELSFDIDFQTAIYQESDIHVMYKGVCALIEQWAANPYVRLDQMDLLLEVDRQTVLEQFNDIQKPDRADGSAATVIERIDQQARRTPDRIAVRQNGRCLSYLQLYEASNQLAQWLRKKIGHRQAIVAVCCTHSFDMVIAILAVLKAGAAYLPMDPQSPLERLGWMLREASCELLLTNCAHGQAAGAAVEAVQVIDLASHQTFRTESSAAPEAYPDESDLAYIMYTSGSTGQPKGVMIEHRSLLNYIEWANDTYTTEEEEVFALYTSIAFDLTVTSIFTPLIAGHQIDIYDPYEADADFVLYRVVQSGEATVLKLTPSHLALLRHVQNGPGRLRTLIVGGEALPSALCESLGKEWLEQVHIFNEYGPTEATVGCMIHRYDPTCPLTTVPIGTPARGMQIYVLDRHLHPVPTGVKGQIYIAGEGVARGYLHQPELTYTAFIANPFRQGTVMYATGDVGMYLNPAMAGNDGTSCVQSQELLLMYCGRADRQLKVRGHRVEPAEIERHLLQQPEIRQAVVVLRNISGQEREVLCAYIVRQADHHGDSLTPPELQDCLRMELPEYMIPSFIITVDQMPLTLNGKLSLEALPLPELGDLQPLLPGNGNNLTPEEQALLAGMRDIMRQDSIQLEDDFYALGGDSIIAIQVTAAVRDRGYGLHTSDILQHPHLRDLARYMTRTQAEHIGQQPRTGDIKPTPMSVWFFAQSLPNPEHYNQSVLLHFKKPVTTTQLEAVWLKLVQHHDALRINYNLSRGTLFYNEKHLAATGIIEQVNLLGLSRAAQQSEMNRIASAMKSGFELTDSLLIRGCFFLLQPRELRLLVSAHHLTVDAVSWRILLEDVQLLLQQLSNGLPMQLPAKTHSYQEWAVALHNNKLHSSVSILEYEEEFNSSSAKLENNVFHATGELTRSLDPYMLSSMNFAYHTHTEDILLIALALTVNDLTGRQQLDVEVEGHGRQAPWPELDLSRTVGWFTSMDWLMLTITSLPEREQIQSLKEQIRQGRNIQGHWSAARGEFIRFNYLGRIADTLDNEWFTTELSLQEDDCAQSNMYKGMLEMNSYMVQGKFHMKIRCRDRTFLNHGPKVWLQSYISRLDRLIRHCMNVQRPRFTPSDFATIELSQHELNELFHA